MKTKNPFGVSPTGKIPGTSVYFESVTVHHGKGEVIELPFRCMIKAGEGICVFDLPGKAAFASSIRKLLP